MRIASALLAAIMLFGCGDSASPDPNPTPTLKFFASLRDPANDYEDLYTFRSDGSELVRVTNGPLSFYSEIAVSPLGTELLVVQDSANGGAVRWVMAPDGTSRHPFVFPGSFAKWSPDGSMIAWHTLGGPVITTRTGAVLDTLGVLGQLFAWAPDSRHVALGDGGPILVGEVGGSALVPVSGTALGSTPAWSPSGDEIAFLSDEPDSVGLSIANVTSATSQLLRPIRVGEFVDWAPDGRYISVVDYNGTVTIVDRATAATRAITGFPAGSQFWRPQWAADGSFVVRSDGSLYVVAPNANVAHRVDVGNLTVTDAAIVPEP